MPDAEPHPLPGQEAEEVVKAAVGAACRMAQARTGLGVTEFCERAGVSRKHFSEVTSGRGDPGTVWLRRIAVAAGWDLRTIARLVEDVIGEGRHPRQRQAP